MVPNNKTCIHLMLADRLWRWSTIIANIGLDIFSGRYWYLRKRRGRYQRLKQAACHFRLPTILIVSPSDTELCLCRCHGDMSRDCRWYRAPGFPVNSDLVSCGRMRTPERVRSERLITADRVDITWWWELGSCASGLFTVLQDGKLCVCHI